MCGLSVSFCPDADLQIQMKTPSNGQHATVFLSVGICNNFRLAGGVKLER